MIVFKIDNRITVGERYFGYIREIGSLENLYLENVEIIKEFENDKIISDEVQARIRNKLSPIKNLLTMLDVVIDFNTLDDKFEKLVKKEMKKASSVIIELSNLNDLDD